MVKTTKVTGLYRLVDASGAGGRFANAGAQPWLVNLPPGSYVQAFFGGSCTDPESKAVRVAPPQGVVSCG